MLGGGSAASCTVAAGLLALVTGSALLALVTGSALLTDGIRRAGR